MRLSLSTSEALSLSSCYLIPDPSSLAPCVFPSNPLSWVIIIYLIHLFIFLQSHFPTLQCNSMRTEGQSPHLFGPVLWLQPLEPCLALKWLWINERMNVPMNGIPWQFTLILRVHFRAGKGARTLFKGVEKKRSWSSDEQSEWNYLIRFRETIITWSAMICLEGQVPKPVPPLLTSLPVHLWAPCLPQGKGPASGVRWLKLPQGDQSWWRKPPSRTRGFTCSSHGGLAVAVKVSSGPGR